MQSRFSIDKIKGLSPNHVFVQKSRWPYSMQSKFGMDKIQGSYKLEWLYGYIVVPGHYQHKHCHYCSNNHYSIPSVTYVYLFILDVE